MLIKRRFKTHTFSPLLQYYTSSTREIEVTIFVLVTGVVSIKDWNPRKAKKKTKSTRCKKPATNDNPKQVMILLYKSPIL